MNPRPPNREPEPTSDARRQRPSVLAPLVALLVALAQSGCLYRSSQVGWQRADGPVLHVTPGLENSIGPPHPPRRLDSQRQLRISPGELAGEEGARWEVWARPAGTTQWKLIAEIDNGPGAAVTLPAEGIWELSLRRAGLDAGAGPIDERADAVVSVDETPPEIALFEAVPGDGPRSRELRWRVEDRSLSATPVTLQTSTDSGESWRDELRSGPSGTHLLDLPPAEPGQSLLVRLLAVDRMDNRSTTEPLELLAPSDPSDASYPRLRCPAYARGGRIPFSYELDPGLATGTEVTVELWGRLEGEAWVLLGRDEDGESPLELELRDGRYDLQLVARTPDSPEGEEALRPERVMARLAVDRQAPTAAIAEATRIPGEGPRVRLVVDAADRGPAGIETLLVDARWDSEDRWASLGDFAPSRSLTVDPGRGPGRVQLRVRARDRAGNEGPEPAGAPPPALVSIGLPDFDIEIQSFAPGTVFAAGSRHYIFLRSTPHAPGAAPERVSIHYSIGERAAWVPIVDDVAFADRFAWTLPGVTSSECRLRVDARDARGLRARYESRSPFAIDGLAPMVRVKSADAIGGGQVLVQFVAEADRPAGLKRLWLYRTDPSSPTGWTALPGSATDDAPWVVQLPGGRHGLAAGAEDRVGNRTPPPGPELRPRVWVEVEEFGDPVLVLKNFHGGKHRGGERRYVFWDYRGPEGILAEDPFSLAYSRDEGETWIPIDEAGDLPLSARQLAWTLPRLEGEKLRLQVRARLRSGHLLSSASAAPFLVETRAPAVLFVGPSVDRSQRTEIRFQAWSPVSGPAVEPSSAREGSSRRREPLESWTVPLARVECYASRVPDAAWVLAGSWEAPEGALVASAAVPVTLGEGHFRIALVVRDRVGNESAASAVEGEGGGRILIDTRRPELTVLVEDPRELYVPGEEIVLNILAEDPHLGSLPVSLELSDADDSVTPRVLEPGFPARGRFSLDVPEGPGTFRLRVRARDIAGNETSFAHAFSVTAPRREVRGGVSAYSTLEIESDSPGSDSEVDRD